jgi:hypothetical protein
MKLIKPENIKQAKPKFIISGKAGVGKTMFMLSFEKPVVIDTEGGATRPEYVDRIKASGGVYMGKEQGSQDFKSVIDTIKELATTQHEYKTLIIDSFSKLYNLEAAIAEERVGNEYGRDKKEANKPTRQLQRWLEKLDMTVGLVCHSKSKWEKIGEKREETGTTYDGPDKMEYDLDLWIEAQLTGKSRAFVVKKSRIKSFVLGNSFPLDYETFANLYGRVVVESNSVPVACATDDQISEIKRLVDVFNISPEDQIKGLKKYDCESYDELSQDQAAKIIEGLTSKLKGDKK